MYILLQFTEYGIEGVVPLELLPPDVRSKYQAKPNDRSKRNKKEDAKNNAHQVEENQVSWFRSNFSISFFITATQEK